MIMKKTLSLILTVVMILASMATVSAAYTFEPDIDPGSVYDVTVTVEVPSYVKGTMTAKIIKDGVNNRIFGIAEATPEKSGDKNVYKFLMYMPADAITAEDYYVELGGNVKKNRYNFSYTNPKDAIHFYDGNELADKDSLEYLGLDKIAKEKIQEYLGKNVKFVPVTIREVEYVEYTKLEDKALGFVNTALADETLSTGWDGKTDTISTYVGDADTKFATIFKKLMFTANMVDVADKEYDAARWEEIVNAAFDADVCNAIFGDTGAIFDNKYYTAPEGETALLEIGDVYSYFVTEIADLETLDVAEYKAAFDKATLMALEAASIDSTTFGNAFMYFAEKGTTISDDNDDDIVDIVNADKDLDLWDDVKAESYSDYAALEAKAIEIAEQMVEDGVLEDNSSVGDYLGGNGSSGGNGGTSSNDNPKAPGGISGPSSDVDIKPADPVNPTQPDPVEGFTDLVNAEWSREAVEYLADNGVINGKDENTFAPNDPVTREEGAKIIVAAFDLLTDSECDFTDVAKDRWSYAYIAAAVEHGIINGYGEEFGPTDTMTREQAATIIFRAAEKITLEISGEKAEFTDDEHASDWAADAIAHLAADGVINGMGDGTFAPKATLTRAQLAQLVYNVLVLIGGVK